MGDPSPTRGRAAARLAEEPLAPAVAGAVADDPAVAQFIRHLAHFAQMAADFFAGIVDADERRTG